MINIENFNLNKLDSLLALSLLKKQKLIEMIVHNQELAKEFTFDKQNDYFNRIILTL